MKPGIIGSAKHKFLPQPDESKRQELADLAANAKYDGNPEHKRNPGDFGLSPPSQPRQGKSLCDDVKVFTRAEALQLLREGIRRGIVSADMDGGWPNRVWAVSKSGEPMEARQSNGVYHGFPLRPENPLYDAVLDRWNKL